MNLAFATCRVPPEPDIDEPLFMAAAEAAGIEAELAAWDDPTVDWSRFDLVVPRSTWNYYEDEAGFRRWIERVASQTRLLNPPELMLWNVHKSYLLDLEARGVPIVPTRFVLKGSTTNLSGVVSQTGWNRFVVKPAVSASSYMTRAFSADECGQGQVFLGRILAERDAMVQEYQGSVPNGGEVAFIHIDGVLTHGVVKNPRFHEGEECVSDAVQPDREQAALASQVMSTVECPWLYSRVDMMLGNEGQWLLSELELIEPSLFFRQNVLSLERFVGAICRIVPL